MNNLKLRSIIYTKKYDIFKDKKFIKIKKKRLNKIINSCDKRRCCNHDSLNFSLTMNRNAKYKTTPNNNNNDISLKPKIIRKNIFSLNILNKKQKLINFNKLYNKDKINIEDKKWINYIDNIFEKNKKFILNFIKLKDFEKMKKINNKNNEEYLKFYKFHYFNINKNTIENIILKLYMITNKIIIPINKLNLYLNSLSRHIINIKNYRLITHCLIIISNIHINVYNYYKAYEILIKLFQFIFLIDDYKLICFILENLINFKINYIKDYESIFNLSMILLIFSWFSKNDYYENQSFYFLSKYYFYKSNLTYAKIFENLNFKNLRKKDKKIDLIIEYYQKLLHDLILDLKIYKHNYIYIKDFYKIFDDIYNDEFNKENLKNNYLIIKVNNFINWFQKNINNLFKLLIEKITFDNNNIIKIGSKILITHNNYNSNPFNIFQNYNIEILIKKKNIIFLTERLNINNIKLKVKNIIQLIKFLFYK